MHHVCAQLSLSSLSGAVHLFTRYLCDPTLSGYIQATCGKLILNLVDCIVTSRRVRIARGGKRGKPRIKSMQKRNQKSNQKRRNKRNGERSRRRRSRDWSDWGGSRSTQGANWLFRTPLLFLIGGFLYLFSICVDVEQRLWDWQSSAPFDRNRQLQRSRTGSRLRRQNHHLGHMHRLRQRW